jgi:hypothetical protein
VKRIAVLLVALSLAGCGRASSGTTTEPAQPEQPRPPSEPFQTGPDAEELYKADRMAEAAWVFEQVLSKPPASDYSQQRAEFWLAKSYFQLADYSRALALFRAIASDPQHEYHQLALPWLMSLTKHRYDEAAEALSWYPIEAIEDEAFDLIRDELLCFYGGWHTRHGQRQLGEQLLQQVPEDSDYYGNARVALAESMWRAGHEHEALPHREALERWNAERATKRRRDRKQPPPEHIELAIERLRSRGVPVGPHGEL